MVLKSTLPSSNAVLVSVVSSSTIKSSTVTEPLSVSSADLNGKRELCWVLGFVLEDN